MKAKKLPSGNWNVRAFSHTEKGKDGKEKKIFVSFTAPTKAEALRRAAEFVNNKELSRRPQDMTVGQCIDKYISLKENVLSPSTIRGYRSLQRNDLERISDIRVGSLTNAMLQEFISEVSASLSPKTVRNIYALLTSSIGMFTDRHFKVTLPSKRSLEYNIPTSSDVAFLMDNASPKIKMCIALAGIGTLRRGEICGLKYKDVLYDFNAVYVHTDMVYSQNKEWIHKDIPKTSSSIRRVDLPPEVIALIGEGDPEEFIYPGTPSSMSCQFSRLLKKCGLSFRFHDLRHYAASVMHAIGVPDVYIMQRGGWKSDTVLKSVYRNSLSDHAKKFTSLTNDYFQKSLLSDAGENPAVNSSKSKPEGEDAKRRGSFEQTDKKTRTA